MEDDRSMITALNVDRIKDEFPTVDRAKRHDIVPPEIAFEELVFQKEIGKNAFCSVWKGTCRGIAVAIKKLNLTADDSIKLMNEYKIQLETLHLVRHPNLVQFLGACTKPGHFCVVFEWMDYNLNELLESKTTITFVQKIKLAIDAAAGMAWLHNTDPPIIHGQLKSSNFMITSDWKCKIADFEISDQVKMIRKLRQNASTAIPYTFSPEVLRGAEPAEIDDIYSYGIVMYELFTQNRPFSECKTMDDLVLRVTKEKYRPSLPDDLPHDIKKLIRACWNEDISKRPRFLKILTYLRNHLVDLLIDDKIASEFWKVNFSGKERVPWTEFQNKFATLLKLPPPNAKDLNFQCLKKMIVDAKAEKSTADTVSIEKFSHVVNWFGPIVLEHKGFSILDKIRVVMQKDWFHGDISKTHAENILTSEPPGTFLVRTSVTEKTSPFTISRVNRKGEIDHQRITKSPDGLFKIIKKDYTVVSKDNLLPGFISLASKKLRLDKSCPGSPYRSLFVQTKSEGYL